MSSGEKSVADKAGHLVELLIACSRRDGKAFATLYRSTSPKLFAVAIRILRNRSLAEEVLQDCFVSIWNHAGDYSAAKSAPMTWMTTIVRNRSLDLLRGPKMEASGDTEAVMEMAVDENPGPLERLLSTTDASSLAHCLQTLEARQRQSIALAFFHGLTHTELAAHLRQPLGTVKTWVRRGLQQLKTSLDKA